MNSGSVRPQQLLCTVSREGIPVLEVWFLEGRGSRKEPLRFELLGDVDGAAAMEAVTAVEGLMNRHGPWLSLDTSRVDSMDAAGRAALERLVGDVTRRGGGVSLGTSRASVAPALEHDATDPTAGEGWHMRQDGPRGDGSTPVTGRSVEGSALVLTLSGEVDAANSGLLYEELRDHLDGWSGPVLVDMADVSFLDSTGITCFVRLRNEVAGTATSITLRNPTPIVRRTLEITGLLEELTSR